MSHVYFYRRVFAQVLAWQLKRRYIWHIFWMLDDSGITKKLVKPEFTFTCKKKIITAQIERMIRGFIV